MLADRGDWVPASASTGSHTLRVGAQIPTLCVESEGSIEEVEKRHITETLRFTDKPVESSLITFAFMPHGLSEGARSVCDGTFSIAQFGSTRSINASAAGISSLPGSAPSART
mgnify:CR=1 FL=1